MKFLGFVAALTLMANGFLLAGFLGLEIESQIHALVTRDEKSLSPPIVDETAKWSGDPPELPPPSQHPPLEIVAGEFTFTVHYTTREWLLANDCEAATFTDKHQIWMSRSSGSSRDVLMHELFHVAKYVGARPAAEPEAYAGRNPFEYQDHEFINPAAPALLLMLRRNPQLTAWLTEQQGYTE